MHEFLKTPQVAATYHSEWQDGFGAQGWKLNLAIDDPCVIACTSYTGAKSPTSVIVHDILDHLISGFWLSGYSNEARATAIHGLRNGIEVCSSYEWMISEIVTSKYVAESLDNFFPPSVFKKIPADILPGQGIAFLLEQENIEDISNLMLQEFINTGIKGIPVAAKNWEELGLDFGKMHAIGLCLQALLEEADKVVTEWISVEAVVNIIIGNDKCEFLVKSRDPIKSVNLERLVDI